MRTPGLTDQAPASTNRNRSPGGLFPGACRELLELLGVGAGASQRVLAAVPERAPLQARLALGGEVSARVVPRRERAIRARLHPDPPPRDAGRRGE